MPTVLSLAETGAEWRLNVDSHGPGVKDPDAETDGRIWEFKAPQSTNHTVSSQFERVCERASRLVIDLRRCGLDSEPAFVQAERRFAGQPKP